MSSFMQKTALVASLAAMANAHGRLTSISAGGKEYPGFMNEYLYGVEIPADLAAWSAQNGDNGFVGPEKYGSAADIACHLEGKPGGGAATVAAGSKVTVQWGTDVWPESHHGPVIDYLAKCAGDDCSSVSAADLSFFKIDEAGLNDGSSAPGQWASDDLIAAGGKWEVTIPESLAPGQYVLRHEIIALHSAGDANGAQNYPQCFNLEVTGGGSAEPAGVTADKLYTPTDAGIKVSIYTAPLTYEIPGPAVWDGASSGGGAPPAGGASSAAPTPSSAPAGSAPTSYAAPSTPASTPVSPASSSAPYGGSNSTIPATGTGAYPTATGAPVPSSTYSAPAPPPYATDVPVDPVSEVPSATPSTPAATSSSPAAPTPTASYPEGDDEEEEYEPPTSGEEETGAGSGYGTSKPLPEGVTLKDLLGWLNYYVKKGYETESGRKHARDIFRRL